MDYSSRPVFTSILLATSVLGYSKVAVAQSAEDSAPQFTDIVVTAQKRAQNLQDVPLSIQAISTEKLSELQIQAFQDYVKFLPSVATQNVGPGYSLVHMRGVVSGGDGNHSGSLPTVGTYLDDQPITTVQGNLDIHLYDIARVEALAGPQGTLYGASSEAGTIRIITNKPDAGKFEGAVDAELNTVAHGDMGGTLEGFINAPLSEKVAVRAVGWYRHDGGYIDNVRVVRDYPSSDAVADNEALIEDDFNDVDTYGGRLALGIDLDDNWTIMPTIMGQKQKSHGTFGYNPEVGDLDINRYRAEFQNDRWYQTALSIQGKIGNFDVVYSGAYLKRKLDGVSDYADYTYAYDVYYHNIGYEFGEYFVDDNGNPTNPSQYFRNRDRFTKQSHELRISSPAEHRLRLVAGLFYQRQKHDIEQRYMIDKIGTAIEVPGWSDTIWLTKQDRIDRDKAVFGELAYDITPALTVTGGLRYFEYNNTLVGFNGYGAGFSSTTGEAACFGPPTTDNAPCTNLGDLDENGNVIPKRAKGDGVTHRLNLSWKIDPERMVYVTWSRGFRPGGINRRTGLDPYNEDYLTNYEFGWKTTWFDRHLRWNASFFHQDWKNFQFSILGPNGLTEIRNAARARIRGVESDLSWTIVRGLTLTANAAYIDAKLSENYCGYTDEQGEPVTDCAAPEAPEGTQLPVTPKFKGNMTVRYDFPVGELDAHVQAAAVYQSSVWSDLRLIDRAIGKSDGYGSVDLSAGLRNDVWRAEVFVTNLFDVRGNPFRYTQCAVEYCGDIYYVAPITPRMIGLKVGLDF